MSWLVATVDRLSRHKASQHPNAAGDNHFCMAICISATRD